MFSWINVRPEEEEGLPRTPSLLPQLWVDAVGDTVETWTACSSDVQSHRAGGENQEAPSQSVDSERSWGAGEAAPDQEDPKDG